jgi:hypothetical protein
MSRISNVPKSQLYARASFSTSDGETSRTAKYEEEASFVDEAAMTDAAEAIREVEIDAAEADANATEIDTTNLNKEKLLHMNIDQLRAVAKQLDIPDRETITEQDELVAAIQRSL